MTDIDQQIRDILAKSCPANDNLTDISQNSRQPAALTHSVSVVGNNNVVIAANALTLGLFTLLYICGMLLSSH